MFKSLKKSLAAKPDPAELVDRLRTKHAAAVQALEDARTAFRTAVLEAEVLESADATKRKDEAARAVAAAEARVAELVEAIRAAGDRDTQEAAKAAASEHARRWDAALSHSAPRLKAAEDIVAAIGTLAEAYKRFSEHSAGMVREAPITIDGDGALTHAPDVTAVLRVEMVRAGFPWAAAWPWPVDQIPPLTERIAAANQHLANQRRNDSGGR